MKNQLKRLWSELVRRRVVRTGAVYAAVAFVALQLGEILFPAYGVGPEGMRALLTGLIAAGPLALAASWAYDVSAPRIRRTPSWRPVLDQQRESESPPVRAVCVVLGSALGLGAVTWWVLGGMAGSSLLLISLPSILACLVALAAVGWCSVVCRAAPRPTDSRTVAVLPFLSWGPEGTRELAEVLAEEIRLRLQSGYGFRVASRESSTDHPRVSGAARMIQAPAEVSTVVEGSLVVGGTGVRVSAQLVDATSGFRVSSRSWEFTLVGVALPQDGMADAIVRGLLGADGDGRSLRAV